MDHTRDPCPWVILNDFGGAFSMGVCFVLLLWLILLALTGAMVGDRWRDMAWCKGIPKLTYSAFFTSSCGDTGH